MTSGLNILSFVILPYVAIVIFFVGTIYRFVSNPFSFSSLSSQFLDRRNLFVGSVFFHIGVIAVLLGHLLAFVLPDQVMSFNSVPLRLYIFEASGLVFGLCAFTGLTLLVVRRASSDRIRAVTSTMDVIIIGLLITELFLGVYIAIVYRWGSAWGLVTAVPYFRSLFTLKPQVHLILDLPFFVRLHMILAFTILGLVPFTRLVHVLVIPWSIFIRPFQLVIWNHKRKKTRA